MFHYCYIHVNGVPVAAWYLRHFSKFSTARWCMQEVRVNIKFYSNISLKISGSRERWNSYSVSPIFNLYNWPIVRIQTLVNNGPEWVLLGTPCSYDSNYSFCVCKTKIFCKICTIHRSLYMYSIIQIRVDKWEV